MLDNVVQWAFFMGTNDINDGSVSFECPSKPSQMNQCTITDSDRHLNVPEPVFMLLIKPVLFLL